MLDPINNIPKFDRLSQYLGLWLIEQTAFGALLDRVRQMDMAAHMRSAVVTTEPLTGRTGAIKRIEVRGTMTKGGSSLSECGSTVAIRREIRDAVSDSSIGGIFLVWDTPGGTAAGTKELHDDIVSAKAVKPVVSFVEDLCCSAGMFAAAASDAIYANSPGAWVGSVGSIMALYDMSGAAEKAGIVPVVISTGEFKATGQPGTVVTDDQKAMLQKLADEMQSQFTGAIKSRGLSTEQLTEVLTAKVYSAADGVRLKLIDGIKTESEALADLQGRINQTKKGTGIMSATAQELRAAFPKASSEFILKQLESGATVAESSGAYCEILQAQLGVANEKLTASVAEIDTLKAQVKTLQGTTGKHETAPDQPPKKKDGETSEEGEIDDEEEDEDAPAMKWNRLIAAQVAKGVPRQRAASIVAKQHPALREQMIAAANKHRRSA